MVKTAATKTRTTRTARKTKDAPAPKQVVVVDTATGSVEVAVPPVEATAAERAAALAKVAKEDVTPKDTEPAVIKVERKASDSKMRIDTSIVPGKTSMAMITPDLLKKLAFVSVYDAVDPKSSSPAGRGYQRNPIATRFNAIARYYSTGNNRHMIPPLMVNVRVYDRVAQARFNFLFNRGEVDKIHAELGRDVFSLIDGNHRMNGLARAWEQDNAFTAEVPVMVLYGLSYLEESRLFHDINVYQVKVSTSLTASTLVHTQAGEHTHAQEVRELAFGLAQSSDSVWNGKVSMTGNLKEEGKVVTFEGLRRSTGNMFTERVLNRLSQRGIDPAEVAKRYWFNVAKASEKAWNAIPDVVIDSEGNAVDVPVKYRLTDLVGVAAVSRLGQDVITTSLDRTKTQDAFWESVAELTSKLSVVNWRKEKGNPFMATPAGFSGMKVLADELFKLVYMDVIPDGDAADAA